MVNPMMQMLSGMMNSNATAGSAQGGPQIPGASPNQMMQIMQLVNKSGGDPQKAFYELAKQRGVDPQAVMNMAKNMGFKL